MDELDLDICISGMVDEDDDDDGADDDDEGEVEISREQFERWFLQQQVLQARVEQPLALASRCPAPVKTEPVVLGCSAA